MAAALASVGSGREERMQRSCAKSGKNMRNKQGLVGRGEDVPRVKTVLILSEYRLEV